MSVLTFKMMYLGSKKNNQKIYVEFILQPKKYLHIKIKKLLGNFIISQWEIYFFT